jgi:XTP/dITP diphosphohydrolase
MDKIKKILIGTNNPGKYSEISDLLPKEIVKYSPLKLNIKSPEETGSSFMENSLLKASYFSKKTNLICLSDDSGLEIDILNGEPGIYSSRWGGINKNFDSAIEKVFQEINKIKKNQKNNFKARFICCMTLYWPDGKSFSSEGVVEGKISLTKKGTNGFGYDPIFIANGYKQTFGEMNSKLKMSIDHRHKAFVKIKKFFN